MLDIWRVLTVTMVGLTVRSRPVKYIIVSIWIRVAEYYDKVRSVYNVNARLFDVWCVIRRMWVSDVMYTLIDAGNKIMRTVCGVHKLWCQILCYEVTTVALCTFGVPAAQMAVDHGPIGKRSPLIDWQMVPSAWPQVTDQRDDSVRWQSTVRASSYFMFVVDVITLLKSPLTEDMFRISKPR